MSLSGLCQLGLCLCWIYVCCSGKCRSDLCHLSLCMLFYSTVDIGGVCTVSELQDCFTVRPIFVGYFFRVSSVIIRKVTCIQWLEKEILKKVGCCPPYWEQSDTVPNCTSNAQLKNLGRKQLLTNSSLYPRLQDRKNFCVVQ